MEQPKRGRERPKVRKNSQISLLIKRGHFFTPSKNHRRPSRLRPTFSSRWQRWWQRHPALKKAGLFSATLLVVVAGLFVARLFFAANKIIDSTQSAVALGENVDPNLLNHEGDGRVNLLLIGVGGSNHVAGDLSDSIMVASLDPVTSQLAFVSFPRDLYVPIEGYGSAKINAAHAYGEQYDYPGGGPKLLGDTITQVFGIPIHYYLRVDFEGFKKAIDVVGGVDVNVTKAINDSAYPGDGLRGYEPFYLPAGRHHLNSEKALKYVRSRYGSSDFDRAARQQQLLLSLKDKILSSGTFLDPLRLNRLLSIASRHVRTSLSVDDGLKLLDRLKTIDSASVKRSNLTSPKDNLLIDRIIDGAWVLTPTSGSFTEVKIYLRRLLPDGYIKREGAKIKILNASGQAGLAKATKSLLKSFGYNVVMAATNPDGETATTKIIDYRGGIHPYTLNYLSKRFKSEVNMREPGAQEAQDITIILGRDYTPSGN